MRYCIALGPIAGRKTLTMHDPGAVCGARETARLLTTARDGFSLNAALVCEDPERDKLERLCRYVSRGPIALKRLSVDGDGLVVYALKHPFRDGATHVCCTWMYECRGRQDAGSSLFEPLDFIARLAATDFLTIEVWMPRGLVTYYILFVIHLATRRVCIVGATPNPNSAFMMQIARNTTDEFDGFLKGYRYLIMDGDGKFTEAFRAALDREGVKPVRCPPRAPTCNAYAERLVRSIKSECFDRMILLGERSLRRAVREYSTHNAEVGG